MNGTFFDQILSIFNYPLLVIGELRLTLWMLIAPFVLIWLLNLISIKIRDVFAERIIPLTPGAEYKNSIAQIIRYFILILGSFIILQNLGINLSTLGAIGSALGIGIGFGLQNVVNNFISGIIILFERPIKVGDRIELDKIHGEVIRIGARSTHVRTNDNITIIVPNSKFISDNVTNWTLNQRLVRFRIPLTIEPGVDLDFVEKVIIDAVAAVPGANAPPGPAVRFFGFGQYGLNLEVRAWSTELVDRRGLLISEVNKALYKALLANDIRIPDPIYDINIRAQAADMHASFEPASEAEVHRTREGDGGNSKPDERRSSASRT